MLLIVSNFETLGSFFLFSRFPKLNKVKIRYCDGSSFTGDVDQVDSVSFYLNEIKTLNLSFSISLLSLSRSEISQL